MILYGTFNIYFVNHNSYFVIFSFKERVLGINTEVKIEDNKLDEDESKKYRDTIYNLLNYIPERNYNSKQIKGNNI